MNLVCANKGKIGENVVLIGKRKWLQLERKKIHSRLTDIELKLYDLHLQITKGMSVFVYNEWLKFLEFCDANTFKFVSKCKDKHNRKLKKLIDAKQKLEIDKRQNVQTVPDYVKNVSSVTFTEEELSFLNKGLNHAMKPLKCDVKQTVVDVESVLKRKPECTKALIRNEVKDVVRGMKQVKKDKKNINDFKTIEELSKKDVFYLKADKGNSLVIMNKGDYESEMNKLIKESDFMELNANPMNRMITNTKAIIARVALVFDIFVWHLSVSNPTIPKLHGLPKIHKVPLKMRPIVSNISAPTYKLAKWLVKKFNEFDPPKGKYVKNSMDFINKIKDVKIGDDEIMVSFDVVSLYPNVPIPEAIKSIANWLQTTTLSILQRSTLVDATSHCMYQNQFQYRNKFYKLRHGTAMGNPLSCFVSNTFMCQLENELEDRLPRVWWRYVDDVFAIIKKSEADNLLKVLNGDKYKSIRFTCEQESDGKLPFLDLMLRRTNTGSIDVTVYRKPTATKRFITKESYCPTSHKMAAFHGMVHRLLRLPLTITSFINEIKHIKDVAAVNGFNASTIDDIVQKHSRKLKLESLSTFYRKSSEKKPRMKFQYAAHTTNKISTILNRNNIDIALSSGPKLKQLLGSTKDKVPKIERSGIYEVTCICGLKYFGQTKRQVLTRFKEHCRHVRLNQPSKSAVAFHALEKLHLNFDPKDTSRVKLLKPVNDSYKLDAWESLIVKESEKKYPVILNIHPSPIHSPLFNLI